MPLQYDFEVPYSGGQRIIIKNSSNKPITIDAIRFKTSVNIAGDPWGDGFIWGSTITSTNNADGSKTYVVTAPQTGLTIAPQSQVVLNYNYDQVNGILGIGMNPTKMAVKLHQHDQHSEVPLVNTSPCDNPTSKRVSVYFPNWAQYGRQYTVNDLPVGQINNVIYAFMGFDASGNVYSIDSYADAQQLPALSMLRQRCPYMNSALSFGGWTLSEPFYTMAANTSSRQFFVRNAVQAMQEVNANGIDIDWEYPITAADANNFVQLLTELRAALDALPGKHRLSIAAPAGIDKINVLSPQQWQTVSGLLDELNLMTYDYHGAWDEYATFMSAMAISPEDPYYANPELRKYSIEGTLDVYRQNGVPANKIVLGLPTYGRTCYVSQEGGTHGLYQPITGIPRGQYDDTGAFDYKCIATRDCNGFQALPPDMQLIPASQNPLANASETPWGYSASTRIALTYDDKESVSEKANLVNEKGLGGVMFWDASMDAPEEQSLITAATNVLLTKPPSSSTTNTEYSSSQNSASVPTSASSALPFSSLSDSEFNSLFGSHSKSREESSTTSTGQSFFDSSSDLKAVSTSNRLEPPYVYTAFSQLLLGSSSSLSKYTPLTETNSTEGNMTVVNIALYLVLIELGRKAVNAFSSWWYSSDVSQETTSIKKRKI